MDKPKYLIVENLTAEEHSRIFAKISIDPVTGCWNWTASKIKNGYGHIRYKARIELAHRVIYAYHMGPLPTGRGKNIPVLDHIICNNPSCCNPAHMRLVSHAENMYRTDAAPAINARKTHCNRGHELPPYTGEKRLCKICKAMKQIEYVKNHRQEIAAYMRAYRAKNKVR